MGDVAMEATKTPICAPPPAPLAMNMPTAMEGATAVVGTGLVKPLFPMTESPQEAMLRSAIAQLIQETAVDRESFAHLREVCQSTLRARRLGKGDQLALDDSVPLYDEPVIQVRHSIANTVPSQHQPEIFQPPKSPQERLRAFVPNAIEKSKSRHARRGTQATDGDRLRWKGLEIEDSQYPVTDIVCMFTGDSVPEGFTKIERSPTGQRADLSKGGGGVFVYLCVSRNSNKLPISEILAIYPDRGEFVPTDYELVQRRGFPANINSGTQGERIFLCVKRSTSSAVVDIAVLFPRKGDKLPYGYLKVDKSPDGHYADLNATTGGTEVCLSYKKDLESLKGVANHWVKIGEALRVQRNGLHLQGMCEEPASKGDEIRDTSVTHDAAPEHSGGSQRSLQELEDYYLYPLLLACFTRHGAVAELAVQSISQCIDSGLFDESVQPLSLGRLEAVVDAMTSVCHQGVKSRFAVLLPAFRKVIRKSSSGMLPSILHATLKSLIFIGDYDPSLIKSVEDELVNKIMSRYEAERIEKQLIHDRERKLTTPRTDKEIAHALVVELIEDTMDGVEISKASEGILGVFKSHASIHSPQFCPELVIALSTTNATLAQQNAFQLLITLTKSVSRKLHATADLSSERHHVSIINALNAVNITLHAAGAKVREHRPFGQLVRRLVFSTVNATALLWSTDIFQASLTLISTLWNHYRRHLKVEFALLFEHLFLRMLRSTSIVAWGNQMAVMDEITPWFQLPHNVVEIFLNYDMERVQQWKIFEHLSAALCSIAEGNGSPSTPGEDAAESAPVRLQIQAMGTILAITRSIMDASGHAHLINRDARMRLLSMEHGGWEQDEQADDVPFVSLSTSSMSSGGGNMPSPTLVDPASSPELKNSLSARPRAKRMSAKPGGISVRMRNELQMKNQQVLIRAIEIASAKSLKKAIEYLVATNFIEDTPRDITSFLRIYHDFFSEVEMGDYLGEGDEDFKVQVRLTYVRAISFKGMTLVESLRHFLTNGGFRLPGEAQKIERMVEAFAQCFWEDSPTSFSSADTAMIIAYSIIMLNTDLHNPQVKKNKMSREQFVKNNRGIDNGKDLPRRFLEEVYDDIAQNPMHIKGSTFVPKSKETTQSAIDVDLEKFRSNVARSVTQADELMKDLSQMYFTFNFVGVDTSISPELIKVLFERVWFYLLALVTSILCDNQSDLTMTMHCLDLLRYCISTCLFLNMPVERRAFCNLLTKVHSTLESDQLTPTENAEAVSSGSLPSGEAEWMKNITTASSDDPWRVMGDIHMLVNKMKETIQRRQRSEELNSVIKRINRNSYHLLKDSTQFIREGDLTKKCRSRNQTYRFFLFNDQLLYADKGLAGYWNPHKSLRLKLTRISDVPESVMNKHAFQISNPVKSFIVFADSARAKGEWMRLIQEAINEATKKITINARRLSYRSMTEASSSEPPKPPPSPSSLAATATTTMKTLMWPNSRLSSPISEGDDESIELVLPGKPTVSPLALDADTSDDASRTDRSHMDATMMSVSESSSLSSTEAEQSYQVTEVDDAGESHESTRT